MNDFFRMNSVEKANLLEYLVDLTQDEYMFKNPDKTLVEEVTKNLIKIGIREKDQDIQYDVLETLYKWSWYPTINDNYEELVENIDLLLTASSKAIALRILIASGEEKYLNVFEKYSNNEFLGVRQIAREGILSIRNKKG